MSHIATALAVTDRINSAVTPYDRSAASGALVGAVLETMQKRLMGQQT